MELESCSWDQSSTGKVWLRVASVEGHQGSHQGGRGREHPHWGEGHAGWGDTTPWQRRWVHKFRIDVGEPLEFTLVDAGQDQLIGRCQRWWRPREKFVEVLAAPAALEARGRKGR